MTTFNSTFFLGIQLVLLSAAFLIALAAWKRLGVTFLIWMVACWHLQATLVTLDDVKEEAGKIKAKAGLDELLNWRAWDASLQLFAYFCLFSLAVIELAHLAMRHEPASPENCRVARLHRLRYILVLMAFSAMVLRPYLVKWIAQSV